MISTKNRKKFWEFFPYGCCACPLGSPYTKLTTLIIQTTNNTSPKTPVASPSSICLLPLYALLKYVNELIKFSMPDRQNINGKSISYFSGETNIVINIPTTDMPSITYIISSVARISLIFLCLSLIIYSFLTNTSL